MEGLNYIMVCRSLAKFINMVLDTTSLAAHEIKPWCMYRVGGIMYNAQAVKILLLFSEWQ